jgi:hypothetical protein
MPGADARVVVDFIANTRGLQKGAKDATAATKGVGSSFAGIGKKVALAGAVAGLAALASAARTGWEELQETQKVAADTNAVIKSTGGVANVTAGHVDDLAGAIMRKSGIDDEAIASGENLLLTFTNIRNEVGKGNDIFDQATKATVDYSVRFKKGMGESATVVGKALNDPIKGMSALSRVGVTFSSSQQKAIKAMQESGDLLGAQKIILAELQKETGGAADAYGKTLPGQIDIAKQSWANLTGEMVGALIPAIQLALNVLQPLLAFLAKYPAVTKVLVGVIAALTIAILAYNAVTAVAAVVTAAWAVPVLIVIAVIAALIAIAILLYKNWDRISAAITAAWVGVQNAANTAKTTIVRAFTAMVSVITGVVSRFLSWLRSNWRTILVILAGPLGLAVVLIARYWSQIVSGAQAAIGAVKSAWNGLKSWLAGVVGSIVSTIGRVSSAFHAVGSAAHAAYESVRSAISSIINYVSSKIGAVRSAANGIANALKAPINSFIAAWNRSAITIPRITIPTVDTHLPGVGKIGGGSAGGGTIHFPYIPPLAKGGVLTRPTLFLGGEAGREIVTPERLLREIVGDAGGYTLNLYTQRADAADIAYGFRRLELLRAGR